VHKGKKKKMDEGKRTEVVGEGERRACRTGKRHPLSFIPGKTRKRSGCRDDPSGTSGFRKGFRKGMEKQSSHKKAGQLRLKEAGEVPSGKKKDHRGGTKVNKRKGGTYIRGDVQGNQRRKKSKSAGFRMTAIARNRGRDRRGGGTYFQNRNTKKKKKL